MAGEVLHTDIERFLIGWYRVAIAVRGEDYCDGVEFDRTEPLPGEPFPKRLVVIRNDGGPTDELLTGERRVGISILAGTKEDPRDAMDLGEMIVALRTLIPGTDPGNPVTRIGETNGPYLVPENQPHARAYVTMTVRVAGIPL